jgi:hypothetical protein
MGLSDEERLSGIYYAIRGLTKISREWKGDKRIDGHESGRFVEVRDLIDELWHALLANESNALHWFMGSSSTNSIERDPHTPWEMAIVHHLSEAVKEPSILDEHENDPNKEFDALRHTSLASLVRRDYEGHSLAYVVETYHWVEQLLYYLRRYPDEFLDRYEKISRIASNIMGECFNIFTGRDTIAKAYVIQEIMAILYGPEYPYRKEEWDEITKFMQAENMQHEMGKMMDWPLKEVAEHHIELVKAKTIAQRKGDNHNKYADDPQLFEARLFLMLKINASKFAQYEHIQRKLFDCFTNHPLLPKVKKEVKRLVDGYTEKKDKDKKYHDEKDFQVLDAYGYDGYRMMDKCLDEAGVHPRQERKDAFRKKVAKKKVKKKTAKTPKKKKKKK